MASSVTEGDIPVQEPEREPLHFHITLKTESEEVNEVIQHIKQVAETLLYHWKTFPIVLPKSLTSRGDEKSLINYRDLFVAPTFDELEQVASDGYGNLKKLSEYQLCSIWERGEFEVPSLNFPGQEHRWKLTQLLQKGSKNAHETLLNDAALALRLLIITAKNRFISPTFSLSESVKSWGRGLWKILDLLFGMPSTSSPDIEQKIRTEHQRYLIAELDVKPNYRKGFGKFCDFVKDTCRLSTKERKKKPFGRPPPVPYIYQTPKGLDIDLRLFNKDLINNCLPVLSNILEREAKGWYVNFRQKMILNLKGQGLSSEQISKEVTEAVKEEYLQRVYKAILSNAELESIEPEIGKLLVSQAKSVIAMKQATSNLTEKMQQHKTELLKHLKKVYPVKSRIRAWVEEQTLAFEREFIEQNQWSEEAIIVCSNEHDLKQAEYFLRRDLNFIRQREPVLLKELGQVRLPNRVFTFSLQIWFPKNWITIRVENDEETVVPTVIAGSEEDREFTEPRRRSALQRGAAWYKLRKNVQHKTSTRYPLWRWYNYCQRTWAWTWNSIFFLGVVVPFCSPLSFRALFAVQEFKPDKEVSQENGKLYPADSSLTHTLISRLSAVWRSVRKSRKTFESSPDRGFIGKSFTRHLNRFWNYVLKGFFGSVLLALVFPPLCIVTSTFCISLAILAPLWVPLAALSFQIFGVVIYDFDGPYEQNRISILFEALIWRFVVMGTIQPLAAVLFGFVMCPLASLGIIIFGVLRRGLRGFWDTMMYGIVIKSRGRVPASDGFVARRVAGPGLASNYCLQIKPEQALAALEANMEQEELDLYKARTMRLIEKPVQNYSKFVGQVFRPFSGGLIEDGPYKELLAETSNYKTDLTNKVNQRQWKLNTGLSLNVQNKIKLPEKELKLTILQAAHMLEAFCPSHVFSQLSITERDFWEKKSLEFRDWTGLASQKLSEIFSPSFLVPLEDTDSHFELKVEHLNLGRYIRMLESADVHDDLDIVTEVHKNTGDVSTRPPQLDVAYFNPTENVSQSTQYRTLRRKKHFWSRPKLEAAFSQIEIPLPIPHPAVIAMTIYNRENELCALNLDDPLCITIIRAIKTQTALADPNTVDSAELEPSTPENGVEPVSTVSHLAEEEHSNIDDSVHSAMSPMLVEGTEMTRITPSVDPGKVYIEDDDDDSGMMVIGGDGVVYRTDAHAETASVNTSDDVGEDIYYDEGDSIPRADV